MSKKNSNNGVKAGLVAGLVSSFMNNYMQIKNQENEEQLNKLIDMAEEIPKIIETFKIGD